MLGGEFLLAVRFRQCVGASGGELILQVTIDAGLESGTVKPRELWRVTVDTTVPLLRTYLGRVVRDME